MDPNIPWTFIRTTTVLPYENISDGTIGIIRSPCRRPLNRERIFLNIRKHLVDLVTVNGRPLSISDDPPMKEILKMAAKSEKNVFTREQLLADIETVEKRMKEIVIAEVKNKMVSVMIDTVRKFGRSVLGINIQYILDDKIILRSIGNERLLNSHTGKYMANVVKDVLYEYGITVEKIYSITADNAANMKKVREELQKFFPLAIGNENENNLLSGEVAENQMDESDIDNMMFEALLEYETCNEEVLQIFSNHNTCEMGTDTDLESQQMLEHVRGTANNDDIISLSGVAHTLQLSILDAVKEFDKNTGLIRKGKDVCVKLRTQNILDMITKRKLPVPVLLNMTRWSSLLKMVKLFMIFSIIHTANKPHVCGRHV